MDISIANLLQQAKEKTGLTDFGSVHFVEPLEVWLRDLQRAHISDKGQKFLTRLAIADLARRLEVMECLKKNPEILETPIPPIVYVTGHERSGTTLLHNLLSLHQNARCLSRWELMSPTPPPVVSKLDTDPRRNQVQKSVDALRGAELEIMHWVNADDPKECVWGFIDCTGLLGMAPGGILPDWFDWLMANNLTGSFEDYRKVIQILTWKNQVQENGFLALKAPQIALHLPAFAKVFPEAKFVYLHRDPFRVLTSLCTLVEIVNKPFLSDITYFRGQETKAKVMLNRLQNVFARMIQYENAEPDRVINILYSELMISPAEEACRIIEAAGLPADNNLEEKTVAFLEDQKKGRRAASCRSIPSFGYDHEELLAESNIASYMERYNVQPELHRNTGDL